MLHAKIIGILVFLAVLGIGMPALAKTPDWVNGQSARFPQGLYLVGVGQSDSQEGAESDALAALAKIFHAQISQQTADWQKYIQVESRGKSQVEQKQSIESLTKVSTNKVLEGAEIVERAQEGSVHYALAVIDRLQSATTLTERVASLDQKINASLDLARSAPDKLSRIKNYKLAIKMFLLRDAYNTDLQIVNVKGGGVPTLVSPTKIVQEFESWLAQNFLIDVKVGGAQGAVVQKAIIASLLKEGFPIKGGPAAGGEFDDLESGGGKTTGPDLLVRGEVILSPVNLPGQEFKYVRWCVDIEVQETKGNRIVGVVTRSGREGHLSRSEAEARATRALQSDILADVGATLAEYFTGEFQPVTDRPSSCMNLITPAAPPAPPTPNAPPAPNSP